MKKLLVPLVASAAVLIAAWQLDGNSGQNVLAQQQDGCVIVQGTAIIRPPSTGNADLVAVGAPIVESQLAQDCVGPTGPQGPVGATGPVGAQGSAGSDGRDGEDGRDGRQGAPGQRGERGAVGPAGATGPQGPIGPQGPTGAQGLVGPQGPIGEPGPAGPTGPQGLVGPQGPAGEPGAAGATGATGPWGPEGPTGATGAPGEPGATGATGAPGPAGSTGPQGEPGPAGPTGPQGEQGPPGSGGGGMTLGGAESLVVMAVNPAVQISVPVALGLYSGNGPLSVVPADGTVSNLHVSFASLFDLMFLGSDLTVHATLMKNGDPAGMSCVMAPVFSGMALSFQGASCSMSGSATFAAGDRIWVDLHTELSGLLSIVTLTGTATWISEFALAP